jgi:GT2 family glycosyltransferase
VVDKELGDRATIVVLPREANGPTLKTIERLVEKTPETTRLVVVDGGSPSRAADRLTTLADQIDCTLIQSDAILTGNEARNLAMPHVHTEFVAFVENDVSVDDGWLEGLIACADETDATVVSPVITWGPAGEQVVHCAGGVSHIVEDEKGRSFDEHNHEIYRPAEHLENYVRAETEYFETHCLLVRTDAVRAAGEFDEALKSTVREKSDFALRIAEQGGTAWLEPSVVVSYGYPKRLSPSDQLYFRARWSNEWNDTSLRHFNDKWKLTNTEIDEVYRMIPLTRRLGWRQWGLTGRKRRLYFNKRQARHALDLIATPVAVHVVNDRREHAAPPRVVHRATWDRADE